MTGVEHTPAVTAFFDEMSALALAGDPRLTLLGAEQAADRYLARLAAEGHRIVWNMQTGASLRSLREGAALNARSRADGADLRLVVPAHVIRRSPLHTSFNDPLRVGSVPRSMLVTEDSVLISGPLGTPAAHTLWLSTDPELAADARAVYEVVWEAAVPAVEAGALPPLPERTLEVALLLVDGATDRDIAARLGISLRTVSAEVRHIVAWVGARSRGHAVALLVGAGR